MKPVIYTGILSIFLHSLLLLWVFHDEDNAKQPAYEILIQPSAQRITTAGKTPGKKKENDVTNGMQQASQPGSTDSATDTHYTSDAIAELSRDIQNSIEYPAMARRMRYEGTVQLAIEIKASASSATRIKVLSSSGYPELDNAAISALKKWKFSPPLQATDFELSIKFHLSN